MASVLRSSGMHPTQGPLAMPWILRTFPEIQFLDRPTFPLSKYFLFLTNEKMYSLPGDCPVATTSVLAIYSGSKAQGPAKVIPVVDGGGLEPQAISALDKQDISDKIPIELKRDNDSGLILVLVELTDRPLAQIYAEIAAQAKLNKQ